MSTSPQRAWSPEAALRFEIEEFLYREADLLDERRFEEWLALFSDDLRYRVPIARNLRAEQVGAEYLEAPLDVSWFDEGKSTLAMRVAQLRTGVHWAEEPLSRVAHVVTNIRVLEAKPSPEEAQEVRVGARVLVYRNRNVDQEDTLVARRVDRLRRHEQGWLIVDRTVYINQTVLLANNLSFFV